MKKCHLTYLSNVMFYALMNFPKISLMPHILKCFRSLKKNGSRLAKLPVLSSKIEELYNNINISNHFYLKAIRRDGSSGGCCRMAIITKVVYLYYFIKLYCVIRVPVWVPFMEWIGSGTQLDIQLEEGGG